MKKKLTMTELTVLCWLYKKPRRPDKIKLPMMITLVSVASLIQRLRRKDFVAGRVMEKREIFSLRRPGKIYKITAAGRTAVESQMKLMGQQLSYLRSLVR
ncbi:hypothetical protein LCGC14_0752330 [marine sediment metagenome]|uniref:Transcription regulator PadR N-terminal domain-containing protein n=1 Tax=marine sediment metagenome TaxID=412755 RepID=A0A0F9TAL8_9ZZZZ